MHCFVYKILFYAVLCNENVSKWPGMEGDWRLYDVETGETRRIWLTRRELEAYEKVFQNFEQTLRDTCMKSQIDYLAWPTELEFEDLFVQLLSQGSALAGT